MNLKQTKLTVYGLIIGIILCALLIEFTKNVAFAMLALLLAVVLVVVNLLFWRCPHCGEYLGRDVGRFCTYCGEELEL